MKDERMVPVEGALMVGPDGDTYFIPSEALESFRIPDDEAGPARESLGMGRPERLRDLPPGVKVVNTGIGRFGNIPQAGPTTIPGFVDFGHRSE